MRLTSQPVKLQNTIPHFFVHFTHTIKVYFGFFHFEKKFNFFLKNKKIFFFKFFSKSFFKFFSKSFPKFFSKSFFCLFLFVYVILYFFLYLFDFLAIAILLPTGCGILVGCFLFRYCDLKPKHSTMITMITSIIFFVGVLLLISFRCETRRMAGGRTRDGYFLLKKNFPPKKSTKECGVEPRTFPWWASGRK